MTRIQKLAAFVAGLAALSMASPAYTQQVIKIGVVEGQEVKAGDFLLKLDSAQYEANAERDRALIQAYQSQLIQSEARMKMDANSYNRQKQLFDSLVQLARFEQLFGLRHNLVLTPATPNLPLTSANSLL